MIEFTTMQALVLALGAIFAGIYLLIRGGGWTIESAVYIARHSGISPMVIGFTVVAFGTSLPEMVVSVLANLDGSPGIALGNVLGSNIANILLVIGVSAIVAPLIAAGKAVKRDMIMMLACTALLAMLMVYTGFPRWAGGLMIGILAAYVFFQYRMALKGEAAIPAEEEAEFSNGYAPYLFLVLGLIAIALGAEFLVRGAKVSASVIGVPEAVIALSVIAFGTSLPELSTCIIAARKGHSDIILGNIIGSNVFNILMIMGVTSLVKPIATGTFAAQLVDFDIWLVAVVSLVFALAVFVFGKISRPVGIVFFAAYILYNIYIYAIYMTPDVAVIP